MDATESKGQVSVSISGKSVFAVILQSSSMIVIWWCESRGAFYMDETKL